MQGKNKQNLNNDRGEIIIYQSDDGLVKLKAKINDETIWLSLDQIAELFGKDKSNISRHLKNIFAEGELDKDSTVAFFATVQEEGNRTVERQIEYYNLDAIISVGYRTNAVDYDPKSEDSIKFFKIVQNKLHYAAHGHTAAEVIYERADAAKPFMGLTTFRGEYPSLNDAKIAKNYLKEDELKILNNLVSGYFDFAEISAIEHKPMYMKDYVAQLDQILSTGGRKLLDGPGEISHEEAIKKATKEYRKFELENPSPVEKAYLDSLISTEKQLKKKVKKQ